MNDFLHESSPSIFPLPCADQISISELQTYADRRFNAALGLLETLSCATLKNVDDGDIGKVADVLHLLVSDGCEALAAIRKQR